MAAFGHSRKSLKPRFAPRQAARIAQIHAEREAEAAKSETQKRVEHFQGEYDHARRNDDHDRAKFLKIHLDTLKEQLASEREAESKAKAFASRSGVLT